MVGKVTVSERNLGQIRGETRGFLGNPGHSRITVGTGQDPGKSDRFRLKSGRKSGRKVVEKVVKSALFSEMGALKNLTKLIFSARSRRSIRKEARPFPTEKYIY